MVVDDMKANIRRERINRPVIGPDSLHYINNENGTRIANFAHSKNFTISST